MSVISRFHCIYLFIYLFIYLVPQDDYDRIKTTFKRYAGHKETISQITFIRDIFAEVPPRISEVHSGC